MTIRWCITLFIAVLVSCSESPLFEREQDLISFHENLNLEISSSDTIKIATFNMQLGFPDSISPFDERNFGGKRTHLDQIVSMIEDRGIDIIFLQEVARNRSNTEEPDQIRYLASRLGFNLAFADDSELGSEASLSNGFTGLGILSRFPVQSSSIKNLISISRFRRNRIQLVTVLNGNNEIKLVNCHFLAGSTEDEFSIQQSELLNYINANNPHITGGDFNSSIEDLSNLNRSSTNILTKLSMESVDSILRIGTFGRGNVIDHLYINTNSIHILKAKISPERYDFLSDHNALEAYLIFKEW